LERDDEDWEKYVEPEPQLFSTNRMRGGSPMSYSSYMAAGSDLRGGSSPFGQPKTVVRTEFPETWLFDMEILQNGTLDKTLKVPDTITSWTAEAICISKQKGLGLADPKKLLVTQDFWSDLRMPAAVKRGEEFPLNISVFNNLDTSLPMIISINGGEELEIANAKKALCFKGKQNKVVSFPTTAKKIGDLNVTVDLVIDNHQGCESVEQGLGYLDRVVRPLKVKAEGLPVEKLTTELKSSTDGEVKHEFEIELPEEIVEDSQSLHYYVSGDILAGSLDNIGNLVRLPTGCGEQNMVKLAPNVYLTDYLNNNEDADRNGELRKKAKRYMTIGYNRQQSYRHSYGAFSIWGPGVNPDPSKGSTWLTAFVVKVFAQASSFTSVDEKKLKKSVDWLLNTQMENGCFDKKGYVHSSSLQGGNSDNSLSAFVTTALIEVYSNFEDMVPRQRLENAILCLKRSENKTDLHAYSLATHAMALYFNRTSPLPGDEDMASLQSRVEFLMEKANSSESGVRFWGQTSGGIFKYWSYSRSSAVEMTAYNIMTLILSNRLNDVVDSIKWMARQQNSQGGFVSTQDTVVALQALALYGSKISKEPINLSGKMTSNLGESLMVKVEDETKQIHQRVSFRKFPKKVKMNLQGTGSVLVQSVLRYNLPEKKEQEAFTVKVTAKPSFVTVCMTYNDQQRDETGMALLEIELLSGFKAISPEDLTNEIDSGVEKVEEDEKENVVVLYFDKIDKKEKCVTIDVKEEFVVKDRQPARVSVFDYYEEDERVDLTYTL